MRSTNHLFVFLCLICSCVQRNSDDTRLLSSETYLWKDILEADEVAMQDLFNKSDYLVIDIPSNQPFYTADKIQAGDSKYFLGDIDLDNTILIVDDKGNVINQIETGGNGPGEIPRMEDFTYHPERNTLLILTGWKIFEFSTSGEYIRDIRLPINEVFHFITLGKGNNAWLYTSPPPYDEQLTKGFRLLSLIDLESGAKVDSLFEIPQGRVASYSGTKELSFQNKQIVYAPAFGNNVFQINPENGHYKKDKYASLTESNDLYGLSGLDEFFERLQDEGGTTFVDNFIFLEEQSLFFLYKRGMYPRWGLFDPKTEILTLAKNLKDRNLELPIIPFFDVQDNRVFRLLDSEYFDQILEQDVNGEFTKRLQTKIPSLMNQENKLLLCIYEN